MSLIPFVAQGLRAGRPRIPAVSQHIILRANYVIATKTVAPSTTTAAKTVPRTTVPRTSVRTASSPATGTGNPDIIETLPNTAHEVDIPPSAVSQSAAPPADASSPYPDLLESGDGKTDWSRSYHGLSSQPFPKEVAEVLMAPIDPADVEIKPDGLIYLPEIKYRRVLNRAFGPGGWGLAPRSETNVSPKIVSREYALVCLGRLVGIARGEQEYFDASGIATATEACKSNALMRCCKDLGIASELWDPRFIREYKAKHAVEVFATHLVTQRKKKLWRRKDAKIEYPYKEG